jgi:hypothetical protein
MVVQNFPAGLNLFGCRFLSRNQIRLKKISVFSHRGVGTTPLRAGGRDSVVNKNKTKYLKGVPKVFIGLLTKDLWVSEKIMKSWSQSEFEPNKIISVIYLR